MKPVLADWQKKYEAKGLVILDIDDGGADTLDALKKDVAAGGETYAVLWDKDGVVCKTYGVEGYPSAYLVGVDGTVLWEGVPNGKLKVIEGLIQAESAKVKK